MALVSERDFWVLIRFDQRKSLSGRVPNSAKRLYVRREAEISIDVKGHIRLYSDLHSDLRS
jgi:hypothetical protein